MSNRYTTSRGIEIEFLPIPRAIQKFYAAHPAPESPMYDLFVPATGLTEHYPLDEKTAETPEEKARLAEYQQAVRDHNEKFLRICFVKGLLIHASMDEWLAEQKALEIPVAEDTLERKIEWILDAIILTEEDFKATMLGVMKASGANEELVTQIESLFRGEVGKSEGADAERTTTETRPAEADPVTPHLVLQSEIRGSAVRVREGDSNERIRPPLEKEKRQSVPPRRTTHKKSNGDMGAHRSETGSVETESSG